MIYAKKNWQTELMQLLIMLPAQQNAEVRFFWNILGKPILDHAGVAMYASRWNF